MKQLRNRLCRCLSRLIVLAWGVLCASVCVSGEESTPLSALMSTANRMADPTPKAWSMNAIRQVDECETGTYEGNLTLTPIQSGGIQPTSPSASAGSDGNSCSYDADGRLTKDPSRGIANIVYNEIGMPQKVLFNNGAYICYVYLANGKKVEQKTAAAPLALGQFSRVAPVSTIYDEAFEISLGTIQRLNVPGGYVTPRDSVFHLYVPDYQGNNVAVINTVTGHAEQLTDYYPYGQPINNSLGASANPYKYGGKELLTANGYNASDFAARWLSHNLPGFQSPAPLAHNMHWLSMYAYCAGDPINLVDLDGKRPKPYEAALMAKHVYGGEDANSTQRALDRTGWEVSTFKTSIQKNAPWYGNGLNSELYQRKNDDGTIEYAYVFAGTNSPTDVMEDVRQVCGLSSQYESAISNAKTISNEVGDSELTFIGHSLGGGEAAAGSMATGRLAITFNPAGLSLATILKHNLGKATQVFNYITIGKPMYNGSSVYGGGDPLNNIQDNMLLTPPGNIIYVPTNSHKLSHSIDWFQNKKLPDYE